MKNKKWIALILASSMIFQTGCSKREEKQIGVLSVEDDTQLEENSFYVLHDGVYSKLYVGEANFDLESFSEASEPETVGTVVEGEEKISETSNNTMIISEPQESSSPDDDVEDDEDDEEKKLKEENNSYYKRILWFGDDWENIPTLYEGDKLIYYSSTTLNEMFTIERFEYLGWTFGVSGFSETSTGRLRTYIEEKGYNVNLYSSAADLVNIYNGYDIIFDKIGGQPVLKGNLSPYGIITGLKGKKTYSVDVYCGTILDQYDLEADVRALGSMAVYKLNDYNFEESRVISINIPKEFNSGYYFVNGFGVFRYVKGKKYDKNTDFNIPNNVTSSEQPENAESSEEIMEEE